MATRGRHDRARDFFRKAEIELADSGVELPTAYDAKIRLLESFSPKTLNNDDAAARLDRHVHHVAEEAHPGAGPPAGLARRATGCPPTRSITTPTLVIGFADDVVLPPHLGREVADAMPNGQFPGDPRHRAPRVHRETAGRERSDAEFLRPIGCSGEPLDGTGPRRRRRTDPRRRPRRRAVPGLAQRPAGVRAARRRPCRPAPAARPHRRTHRRLPGDRAGGRRGRSGVRGHDVGHRGGQPRTRRWSRPTTPACR